MQPALLDSFQQPLDPLADMPKNLAIDGVGNDGIARRAEQQISAFDSNIRIEAEGL
jgi:hypothetical protein